MLPNEKPVGYTLAKNGLPCSIITGYPEALDILISDLFSGGTDAFFR